MNALTEDDYFFILEPFLDMVQRGHRDGIHQYNLTAVIFKHKHHIEVLELEGHSLKMNQF